MKLSRRQILIGGAASSIFPCKADAMFPHGTAAAVIGHGWNTLPLGAGGQLWGFHIANDGSMVCRGDVLGGYVWSGTSAMASITDPTQKWSQVCNFTALGSNLTGFMYIPAEPSEYVQAPGNSNYHFLMTGDVAGTAKYFLYYSTDKGLHFTKSNVSMTPTNGVTMSQTAACYKIAADPNNEQIVYAGMCQGAGTASGVYTTFDRSAGSTWPTFNPASLDGVTNFAVPTAGLQGGVSGIVFDTSLGTTTVNGVTVTKRIILVVGGSGIYETTDGGVNWTNIAPAAFVGTSYVIQGFMDGDTNTNGVHNYFCTLKSPDALYRYIGGGVGGWADITPASSTGSDHIIVDPRASNAGYITKYGANGNTIGWTTTNSTAATPSWGGGTGARNVTLQAASYDIPYLNHIFGQGPSTNYTNGLVTLIDSNGNCFWCGNQSIWYFNSIPNFGVSTTTVSNSFGRGQEGMVGVDMICPPGATYPVLACQDLGAPMLNNTFISYPTDMYKENAETTCQNLEYAADDTSFICARATGQQGAGAVNDFSCYSNDYGKTYTAVNATPNSLWNATVTGSASGTILTVTGFSVGTVVIPGAAINGGNTIILPYGTAGTTGTGGTGTYAVNGSIAASGPYTLLVYVPGGQSVAPDRDHWVTIPNWPSTQYIPAYTTNARAATLGGTTSWALCQQSGGGNMPAFNYMVRGGWSFGATTKPMAVGYGSDLGTIWLIQVYDPKPNGSACSIADNGDGTGTLTVGGSLTNGPWLTGLIVKDNPGHVTANTTITSQITGPTGGAGTYLVNKNQTVASEFMFGQQASTTLILWRSTDYGATFTNVGSTTGQISAGGVYLLSVPGYSDELWLGLDITSGSSCFWRITSARTGSPVTFTVMPTPPIIGGSPARSLLHSLTLGTSGGGYPYLYGTFQENGMGQVPAWLYQGTWTGSTVTWALYGPAGSSNKGSVLDLPQSMQINQIGSLRGDWNVTGRIYVCNNGLGYAYYNP